MATRTLEKVSVIPADDLPSIAANGALTPMAMLAQAVERGADIAVIEKMMVLSERWEANQARKDFDAGIALAKAEMPAIIKDAKGHNDKKYASFSAIAAVVDPVLSKHGLSYRFRSDAGDKINVTCVLSHKSGHSEETTLSGPADTSGSKNSVQAIGSTLTYLQRYSLVQALGLAVSEDRDGNAPRKTGEVISDKQFADLVDLADAVGADRAKFCRYLKVETLADLPASQFKSAVAALEAKRKQ